MRNTMHGLATRAPWKAATVRFARTAFSGLGIFGAAVLAWFLVPLSPVEPIRTEILNSPLRAGDEMAVRSWRHKWRNDCPISATRWAERSDGLYVDLPDRVWRGGAASASYVDLHIALPRSAPPGRYSFHAEAAYACPERTYLVIFPAAEFEVIE